MALWPDFPYAWSNRGLAHLRRGEPEPALADISNPQEAEFFSFNTGTSTSVDLQVQAAGLSLLVPKMTVFDASGHVVATATNSGPLDGNLDVLLGSVKSNTKYYVEVQGATGDVFGVGSYQLAVNLNPGSTGAGQTLSNPTSIPPAPGGSASTPLIVDHSITQYSQSDVDSFTVPKSGATNGVTLLLQAQGVGIKPSNLFIYDAGKNLLASTDTIDPSTGDLVIHLSQVTPGATYLVKVVNGVGHGYNLGAYQLQVDFRAPSAVMPSPFNLGQWNPVNGTFIGATTLPSTTGYAADTVYETLDGLASTVSTNDYKVQSPTLQANATQAMTVTVVGLGPGLAPSVAVYDSKGNPLNDVVLSNSAGTLVIQVPQALSNATYVVEVGASGVSAGSPGNYDMLTTFGAVNSGIATLASGSFATGLAGASQSLGLTANYDQLFSFVLAASGLIGGDVQMTITDASGNVLASEGVAAGQAASLILYLAPGSYTINVVDGGGTPVSYTLLGDDLDQPMAPYTYGSTSQTSSAYDTTSGGSSTTTSSSTIAYD